MSCIPTTSIEYWTALYTSYTDTYIPITSLVPLTGAIRTSDGVEYTPVRTTTTLRAVEVTSVGTRVEVVRTVVGECVPTTVTGVERSVGVAVETLSSSGDRQAESAASGCSTRPSAAISNPTTYTLHPISALSSSTQVPSSFVTSSRTPNSYITSTGPTPPTPPLGPSSTLTSIPSARSSSSSAKGAYDNSTGLLSPASLELIDDNPMSPGWIAGLTLGGLVLLGLILAGVWVMQRRSRRTGGLPGPGGGSDWGWGGGCLGRRGEEPYIEQYDYPEKPVSSVIDPPSLTGTLPPVAPPSPSTLLITSDIRTSTAPPTPVNPYPAAWPISAATPSPRPRASVRAPPSPTPAGLARLEMGGSVWSRFSGLGWQMDLWGGDVPTATVPQVNHQPDQQREAGAAPRVTSSLAPTISTRKPVSSHYSATLSVPGDTSAPARPSSEYTRGADDMMGSESSLALPPPLPVRVITPPRTPMAPTEAASSRVLAGHQRTSVSPLPRPEPTVITSPAKARARPPSASPRPEFFPPTYSQPDTLPNSRSSYPSPLVPTSTATPFPPAPRLRRPPVLQFAKEVSMPQLWLDPGAPVAAYNPASTSQPHFLRSATSSQPPLSAYQLLGRPGSVSSAYDGMAEVKVTPASTAGMRTPRWTGMGKMGGVSPGEIFPYSALRTGGGKGGGIASADHGERVGLPEGRLGSGLREGSRGGRMSTSAVI